MLTIRLKAGLLLLGAMCTAAGIPAAAQEKSGSPGKGSAGEMPAPVIPPQIILAPTEVRADPTLARGCWVRLFPERAYKGANDLTIAGPVSISSLHSPTGGEQGVYWKAKAESLIAGPKARVTLYENQAFRGQSVAVKAGTSEPQLRERFQSLQSIDSLKIECDK